MPFASTTTTKPPHSQSVKKWRPKLKDAPFELYKIYNGRTKPASPKYVLGIDYAQTQESASLEYMSQKLNLKEFQREIYQSLYQQDMSRFSLDIEVEVGRFSSNGLQLGAAKRLQAPWIDPEPFDPPINRRAAQHATSETRKRERANYMSLNHKKWMR